MKKILGIIVLSLLLSGCSSTPPTPSAVTPIGYKYQSSESSILLGIGAKGMSGQAVKEIASEHCNSFNKYVFNYEYDFIVDSDGAKGYFYCTDKYEPTRSVKGKIRNINWTNYESQEGTSLRINKAKNTCKTLGFEEGTEKFTDCTLKLYTQEVENRVALEVARQKSSSASSSSNSGTMTIYDPVRDRQNQIDRGMKMLSGGCTLGIDC